jgi:hypothetical protein
MVNEPMVERCLAAFAVAAMKIERDVLLHHLTDDEERALVGAVITAMHPEPMVERDELVERLEILRNVLSEVNRPAAETANDARTRIQSDSAEIARLTNEEPDYHMLHAALNEARRHDPPLLPSCKEIWAAEIIWRAMWNARTTLQTNHGMG